MWSNPNNSAGVRMSDALSPTPCRSGSVNELHGLQAMLPKERFSLNSLLMNGVPKSSTLCFVAIV